MNAELRAQSSECRPPALGPAPRTFGVEGPSGACSTSRWVRQRISWLALAAVMVSQAVVAATPTTPRSTVVVTTSMLSSAVKELVASDAEVDVVSLVPPGSCPGHFDITPRVVPQLRQASLIVRHDYQRFLEERLADLGVDGRVVVASTPGSLLIPDHYLSLVEQVRQVLASELPEMRGRFQKAVEQVSDRLRTVEQDAAAPAASWRGRKVVASVMQAELCRWLGMDVVAELPRGEDLSPRQLAQLMALDPDGVVANLQEGTRAAEVLAERLGCPLVVLSNFPDVDGYGTGWDQLFASNLQRLAMAWADE